MTMMRRFFRHKYVFYFIISLFQDNTRNMTVNLSPAISKYKYVLIAICFLALPIYYKCTNYFVEVGVRTKAKGVVSDNLIIYNTVAPIQGMSVDDFKLIDNADLDAENADLDVEKSVLDMDSVLDTDNDALDRESDEFDAGNDDIDAENDALDAENGALDAKKANLDAKNAALEAENSNLVAENKLVLQSTASLHRRVNPKSLNRDETEQMLRDSIEMFHLKNFIKPKNEECKKRSPSVIVIGVPKSGTRELMDFVHLHPHIQIFHSKVYEMYYFSRQELQAVSSLTERMPCSFSNQLTMMKNAWYFHTNDVNVPERIHKFNASIRLILMVREPIARTYSHYSFSKDKGNGNNKSFDEMVINNLKKEKQKLHGVLSMSMYDEDMERWLKVFNRSQILIIEHSEFQKDPVSVLKRVENFLGLGHYITSDMFTYNAETGFQCIRSNLTTTGMSCYASDRGRHQDPISSEIKAKLKTFFKPKNKRFFKIIGKSFNW